MHVQDFTGQHSGDTLHPTPPHPRASDRGRATEVKGFCKIGFKRLAFIQAISRLLKLGAARTSFRADKLSATNDSQLPAKKKKLTFLCKSPKIEAARRIQSGNVSVPLSGVRKVRGSCNILMRLLTGTLVLIKAARENRRRSLSLLMSRVRARPPSPGKAERLLYGTRKMFYWANKVPRGLRRHKESRVNRLYEHY